MVVVVVEELMALVVVVAALMVERVAMFVVELLPPKNSFDLSLLTANTVPLSAVLPDFLWKMTKLTKMISKDCRKGSHLQHHLHPSNIRLPSSPL